jgi:hypothetical protein
MIFQARLDLSSPCTHAAQRCFLFKEMIMTGGHISLPSVANQARRALPLEHWADVASAADLARKATALADRYDALPGTSGARASQRRESVARLRAAAASAQLYVHALTGPGPPESGARDRDDAAGDRALAFEDRLAARGDRVQAEGQTPPPTSEVRAAPHRLFERLEAGRTFHQAQGILMARSGMSAAEAFEALHLASAQQGMSLPETAAQVVQEGSGPDAVQTPLPLTEASRGSTPGPDSPR